MKRAVDCPQWSDLQTLAKPQAGPCVSLYLSTLAGRAGEQSAPNRLRHLLTAAEKTLGEQGGEAAPVVLRPAFALCDDAAFWRSVDEGLAIFLAPDRWTKFRLPVAVADVCCVDDHFHLAPLLPLPAENEPFLLLALSRSGVRLWEGDRYVLNALEAPDLAGGMRAVLNYDRPETPRQVRSTTRHPAAGTVGAVFHGQGVVSEHDEADLAAYLRKVDDTLHPLLFGDQRPLVVAAVDYEFAAFRSIATYPNLLGEHVSGAPDHWSAEELLGLAVEVLAVRRAARQRQALEAAARQFGGDPAWNSLSAVLEAAEQGRIEALFVAEGSLEVGRGSPRRFAPALAGRQEATVERAALATLAHGGRVYVVPPDQLPRQRGLLPSLRYAAASVAR